MSTATAINELLAGINATPVNDHYLGLTAEQVNDQVVRIFDKYGANTYNAKKLLTALCDIEPIDWDRHDDRVFATDELLPSPIETIWRVIAIAEV